MKFPDLFRLKNPLWIVPMIVIGICIYGARLAWWWYLVGLRGPLGLFSIPLILCPLAIGFCAITIIVVSGIIVSLGKSQSVLPSILLIIAVLMVFLLPLPEKPPSPEMQYFLENRSDYLAVVEIAANDGLEQDAENCTFYHSSLAPVELKHTSKALGGCVSVATDEIRGLFVRFQPIEQFYHYILYVEDDNLDNPCNYDSYVEQKIENHWYVCQHEWN